jgi:DNA-binding MarR family transcriptional regulator
MAFRDTLGMRLRTAYLTMHRRFNALFADHEVTADQFVLLTLLAEEDGITQRELARRCGSDANTITAMLNRLQRLELIERRTHATDGRAWCVALTDTGRQLQARLEKHSSALHRRLNDQFTEEERAQLLDALGRIAEGMAPASAKAARQSRDHADNGSGES